MTNDAEKLRSFRLIGNESEIRLAEDLLHRQGYRFEPEPFHPLARSLREEPRALGGSLAATFGRIYIQDRSSMLPPVLLAPRPGDDVLDVCASPGSKTGFLAQLVGPGGFVLGNEPSRDRLATLRQNLRRLNLAQTATVGYAGEELPFAPGSWARIQLDPPCSGWGTAEKHPKVLQLWSGNKVAPLIAIQRRLLEKAAEMLAPGGCVLYSTCTTNVGENEEQVAWALDQLDLGLEPLPHPPGFAVAKPERPGLDGVLRVAGPGECGQGFFLALLRKAGHPAPPTLPSRTTRPPGTPLRLQSLECGAALAWDNLPDGECYDFRGRVFFLPRRALELLPQEARWQGTPLGRLAGKAFRPDPGARILLPTDPARLGPENVCDVEDPADLDLLLAGQALPAPGGKGPVGLYYRGLPLGWLARKGRRLLWTER